MSTETKASARSGARCRVEKHAIACRAVERRMRDLGFARAIRGKPARTTTSDKAAPYRLSHVYRRFHGTGPNQT